MELRFNADALEVFALASHDVNPLHMSEGYARKTAYGARVVFGVLGLLECLSRLRPRPDQQIEQLSVDFLGPMFLAVRYDVEVVQETADRAKARVLDGRRAVLRLSARYGPRAEPTACIWPAGGARSRTVPFELADPPALEERELTGSYAPHPAAFASLCERLDLDARGLPAAQAATLLATSYLTGMELPGTRALLSAIRADFAPKPAATAVETLTHSTLAKASPPSAGGAVETLTHHTRVESFDPRFSLLTLVSSFTAPPASLADVTASVFVRPLVARSAPEALDLLLPASRRLEGQLALVTGASRGLGAWLAEALASQGCTVLGSYLHAHAEIEALGARIAARGGTFVTVRGDARDPAWCAEVRETVLRRGDRLDLLICNACPPLRGLSIEPAAVERINTYIAESIAMATVPMAHLLDLVQRAEGALVVISSQAVTAPPAEWPHYVAAKCALEGIARSAARQHPRVRTIIARPPRMLTDLTSTPLDRGDATPVETVAASLTRHLLSSPEAPGEVEVWEAFAT